jgi:hypothetical protein
MSVKEEWPEGGKEVEPVLSQEMEDEEQWERLRRSLHRPSAASLSWRARLIRTYEAATGTWIGCHN